LSRSQTRKSRKRADVSGMTDHGVRHVGCFELRDLGFTQIAAASAATASSRCCAFVAPTMGAVTTDFCSNQARATCACGTPRARAIAATCSTTFDPRLRVAYRLLP
jgi:hypothetical protein